MEVSESWLVLTCSSATVGEILELISLVLWFGKKHIADLLDDCLKEQPQRPKESQPKLCFFVNHISQCGS